MNSSFAIDSETIKKFLTFGVKAPSGDNSQPWEFVIKDSEIWIYNLPDRDLPFYNFEQSGSYVAHGALLENLRVAAPSFGFSLSWQLFPDSHQDPNLVAIVKISQGSSLTDPLFEFIPKRATNRKAYSLEPLSKDDGQAIFDAGNSRPGVRCVLVSDPTSRARVAEASSMNEIVALENKNLHRDFFGHVVWSEKEEREKKSGLYLKTLEFPFFAEQVFRLLRFWPIARLFSFLRVPYGIAMSNAKLYASAGAMGAILISKQGPDSFVEAGMALERAWLTATSRGLSFQLVTGVLFLARRVQAGQAGSVLGAFHQKLVLDSAREIHEIFGAKEEVVALIFRVGKSSPPRAYSSRRLPQIRNVENG